MIQQSHFKTEGIRVLFTTTKRWKQPRYPSMDEWMSQMWYVHAAEHSSDFQGKDIRTRATVGMNLDEP